MLRKKINELQKDNSTIINRELPNMNKLQAIKNINPNINYKKIEKITKNNLPELRLSKIKSRIESEISATNKNMNQSNINSKNINEIQNGKKLFINKKKNNSLTKKNEIVFPKILNSIKSNNIYKQYEKYNNIDSNNSFENNNGSISNEYRNFNTINNSHIILNKIQNKSKRDISNNNNNTIELHKIKQKKAKNICFSQIITTNKSNINNNVENVDKNFQHYLLLQSLPKDNKSYMPIPLLNISSSLNNIHNNEKDSKRIMKNENNKILSNNINNIKSIQVKTIKQSPSAKNINFMENELKELDNVAEKLNKINSILNKLSPISVSSIINKNSLINNINNINTPSTNPISISPDILQKSFPYYEESITSYFQEFSPRENYIIKGFAYNTSRGNIRNYNEDTITVEKIKLKKTEEYFYFFGIYDGHGGNGCSLYLKENLHNYIQEFSVNGIKRAIYESENEFLTKRALDENDNLCDSSGSCGIIAMIKKNQLIISNTGDSRIVLYKNGKIFFVTKDHKPDSDTEKERIKNAGGQIYQSPSIVPIYQNGKKLSLPWRVLPGRLSVSRTFGDIEAKLERFGGKKGVITPYPDVTEIELNNEFDFMVIGCDGIFDVLSNEDLFDIWNIVLKERKMDENTFRNMEKNNEIDIDHLCGDFAGLIIKSALAKNSFDNVSCIVIVFNIHNYDNENIDYCINSEEIVNEYEKK